MSLCIPYVCIVSLSVFACISTCALEILKTYFIDELQIDKVTVYLVIFTTSNSVRAVLSGFSVRVLCFARQPIYVGMV